MDWLNIKTVPGFVMHSQHFELEFVAGFQGGFPNSYLEYQTNWYEVMDLLLSKFEEEPEVLEAFELVASKELEHWARGRSDGDPLRLRIQVTLEEKGYFLPPRGMRKEVKVSFNDKFSTVVLLYVRKKVQLETLKGLAAAKVADYLHFESDCEDLDIPRSLVPEILRGFRNCWTSRFYWAKVHSVPCLLCNVHVQCAICMCNVRCTMCTCSVKCTVCAL